MNEEKINAMRGGINKNQKESDELKEIIDEIEQIEIALHDNEKRLSEEEKNNAYEFHINLGKKITYGQRIQFKHMFSNQYLTLNAKRISEEHGCVTLVLS